ncbi:MAG: hypothetical protein JWQ27_1043 [Ferruginibacter sp.]|nr:hypothetical protein [Ferruginibacter sp.]
MVTCLTGAILVFEKELQQVFFHERYFVNPGTERVSADSMLTSLKQKVPNAKINSVKIYRDPKRTAEISYQLPAELPAKKDKGADGKNSADNKTAKDPEGKRLTAFVNPYSGEIVEIYNHRNSFFYFVMDLHRWMLGGATGKLIVGICTLIFLFILISGIVLWWPRNKLLLKQRLRIKRTAGFKRLNHDYHIVFGFYSAVFLFVFAFTGLAWSFEWFNKGIYTLTGTKMEKAPVIKNNFNGAVHVITAEAALAAVLALDNSSSYYNISLPKSPADPFTISMLPANAPHESAATQYFVDGNNGRLISVQKFADKNKGQRVRATFRPVHVASIFGWPSKVIGFLACLLGTFFPASGIIMWWNRTRKNRNSILKN